MWWVRKLWGKIEIKINKRKGGVVVLVGFIEFAFGEYDCSVELADL